METKASSAFWWLKGVNKPELSAPENANLTNKDRESEISSSLAEYLEKERELQSSAHTNIDDEVDIGSLLEEINRLSAKSPLGPYENGGDRSIEDIMKEAEQIYLDSSKSFEQLSQRSKTSHNISDLLNNSDNSDSTPTPKSISPLPLDEDCNKSEGDSYSDFSEKTEECSQQSEKSNKLQLSNFINKASEKSEQIDESLIKNVSEKLSDQMDESLVNSASEKSDRIDESLIKNATEKSDRIDESMVKKASEKSDRINESLIKNASEKSDQMNESVVTNSSEMLRKSNIRETLIDQKTSNSLSESQSKEKSKTELFPTNNSSKLNQTNLIKEDAKYSLDFESDSSKSASNNKTIQGDAIVQVVDNKLQEEIGKKDGMIQMLIKDNHGLKEEVKSMHLQLEDTRQFLEQTNASLRAKMLPEFNTHLETALEELKDSKEMNTALQVQLNTTNKSHQMLKTSYEDMLASNKQIERRMNDLDKSLNKYKLELTQVVQQKDKLLEAEATMIKLLEIERLQVKSFKMQTNKDSKCILDLNRQIKEMERIIARKHPDSVSALIVAAKKETCDNTPNARRVLEDRIKALEQEALVRDAQNSQVFVDVQDKFNQMKMKYESHIDDLELHVKDLKTQLKRKVDSYDVYTQTVCEELKMIPQKDTNTQSVQTNAEVVRSNRKKCVEVKQETHLIATIRGLQTDLSNKEKVAIKLQREVDELKKTNSRLQKEREGSLKNLTEKNRNFADKLMMRDGGSRERIADDHLEDELRLVKTERDKMKVQLCRIEADYQTLKAKRIQDLNTLQEAHEREISTYLSNITPLREQLEVQQISLTALQKQLLTAKEDLVIMTVERDHLHNRVNCGAGRLVENINGNGDGDDVDLKTLRKKMSHLEMKYEEREHRLRAIVHGLAQKNITNRSCEQCAARHQQLIGYKAELDSLIATLRCLQ